MAAVEAVNLWDGPGNDPAVFDRALGALWRFSNEHPNVLVHCHMGRSRSVMLGAAYLVLAEGMEAEDAIEFIAHRREVRLSGGIVDMLHRSSLLRQRHASLPLRPES